MSYRISRKSNTENWSYQDINAGITKLIPLEQQMVSYQEIRIADTGELDIEGEVIIIT